MHSKSKKVNLTGKVSRATQLVLIGALSILLVPTFGWASSTRSSVEAYWHRSGLPTVTLDSAEHPDLATIESDSSISATHGFLSVEASALSEFGYNHAKIDMVATELQGEKVVTRSSSDYTESMVLTGPAGQVGRIHVQVTVNGSMTNGDPDNYGWVVFSLDCDGPGCESDGMGSVQEAGTFSGSFDINYNEPFDLISHLEVGGNINNWYREDLTNGAVFADFSHTVALTGFEIPTGSTLVTESGTSYPVPYAPNSAVPAVALVSPANGAAMPDRSVTLSWNPVTDPDGDAVTYRVFVCEHPHPFTQCTARETVRRVAGSRPSAGNEWDAAIPSILFLSSWRMRRRPFCRRWARVSLVAVLVAGSLACGGEDGGQPTGPGGGPDTTVVVDGLTPATTYYWGVSSDDGHGIPTYSEVWSFTTP